jgi:proteic killer suppression protein/toxin YoeB
VKLLQIKFDNSDVEKYFNDFSLMQKTIGRDLTKTIKRRYDALKSANNFSIFLDTGLGKPHPLYENLKGMYGVSISANRRLIIQPISDNLSPEALKKCDTIIIKGVEDYHGTKNEWIIP